MRHATQTHALRVIVTLAFVLMAALPTAAIAATPPSGTVSETSPLVAWSGSPQPPTAEAVCDGPNDPTCDNFRLTILPPTSYDEFVVEIVVTPTGGDDYDIQVYDPFGTVAGSSGNSPGSPEQVNLFNPSAGTYTVAVANFAAALPYNATAELSEVTGGGGGPGGGDRVSFALFTPPDGVGTNAGEPSIGSNWNTGRLMYIAGLEVLRIDVNQCTSPPRLEWTDVTFPLQGVTTLDPILFTDSMTGRTFASQLGPKCSSLAFTDDDGENWTPSQGCGINSGVDHQGIGGGPFHEPLVRDPDGTLYPHSVYYCSQDVAIAQCARSDTGGLTFADANPIYNLLECGGLHGHPKVAPDGTVYVPNKNCGGENAVAVSEANGLLGSWEVRRVPGTSSGTWDPSVGLATQPGSGANGTEVGTVYIGMVSNRQPFAAVSNNAGSSWSNLQNVGLGVAPQGGDITNTAFPQVVAGDGDRAAFFFLGTEQPGDASGTDVNSPHIWYPYVSVTYDGGVTWTTTNLSPDDPVQRGNVCASGTTCGASRNLLDFNDLQVDAQGRVVAGYADGCLGSCTKNPPNSGAELATVAIQVSGKRLFSEYDVESVPQPPKFEAELDGADPDLVHVTWVEPDDNGSTIFEYRVYRRFLGEGQATLLASLAGTARSYDDLLAPNDPPPFYAVTAVNAFGESAFCSELSPVEVDDPESACVVPGITLVEDPAGDTNAVINPTGDPSLDLRSVSMAEPFLGPGAEKLVVTIEVEDLSIPNPSAAWRAIWTNPNDSLQYFVSMETCDATAGVKCSYGTFDGTLFSSAGEPEGCSFDADGSIQITVDKALINLDDGTNAGDFLAGVEGRSQLFVGALCTGLLGNADSAGPGDSYEIVTNAFCDGDEPTDPIARDDTAIADQDASVVINVIANDTSFNGGLAVVSVTDPANGSVANNGNGTVTYEPDPGFYSPPVDTFDYTIRDEAGREDSATVTVTVNSKCEGEPTGSFSDDLEPDAEPGWEFETAENANPLSATWAVVTDSSASSPTHSFSSDATTLDAKDDRLIAPAQDLSSSSELVFWHRFEFEDTYDGGVLEVSTDGGDSWVDAIAGGGSFVEGGYNGVIDSGFGSAIAGRTAWTGGDSTAPMSRVTVDLGAFEGFGVLVRFRLVTDPIAPGAVPGAGWWIDDVQFTNTLIIPSECPSGPNADDDAASTVVNTSVTIAILANDEHPDGDPFFLDSVDQPANGSVSINGDSTVTYTPNAGFIGVDTFTYQICDGNDLCDGATVTVTVSDRPNNDPVANPDSATTSESTPVVIDVLANDSDPDNDPITVQSVTQPANGSTVIFGDGRIEYTPNPGFTSPPDDVFSYTISDDEGATATAEVTVTVTGGGGGGGCDLCAEDKPSELTLTYRGGSCSESDNTQGSKADCEDFSGTPPAARVFIIASNDEDPDDDDRVWFSGEVDPGEAFTLIAANGDKDDFGSKVFVHVMSEDGVTLLQTVEIHTSCSAPLIEGERFGSLESGDGSGSGECSVPQGSSGRVHGSGYLRDSLGSDSDSDSDSDSEKINFSFDAKFKKGVLKGKLKLKDKVADVEIDAKQIDSLTTGNGVCNGAPTGAGAFEFTATGDFEEGDIVYENATFRVCGEDNGKHGEGNDEQPADRIYIECVSGCPYAYNTADRTPDDGIDGGNIHLHDPIVVEQEHGDGGESEEESGEGGRDGNSEDGGESSADDPGVLALGPIFLDSGLAGLPVVLTAQLERPLGVAFENVPVTLRWKDELGISQSLDSLTDSFGTAVFLVTVQPGVTEYRTTAGELDSNRIKITSIE